MKKFVFTILFILSLYTIYYFSKDRTKVYIQTNHIEKLKIKYDFNKDNNINRIIKPNQTIEYKYDNNGRKIAKFVNKKIVIKYLWLEKNKPLALMNKENKILQTYIYRNKNDSLPFSITINNKRYFLIYNKMKSLRVVLDENKRIIKLLNYNLNGEVIKDTNPSLKIIFGFAGGIYEPEENLIYYKEGIYNPKVAKWVTKIQDIDIIENLKELNNLKPNNVYKCSATLDTYYHSFLCTNNQCGGLYANNYLNYINGSGSIIDNSNFFNKSICKKINPIYKNSNKKTFSQCVSRMIKPSNNEKFDLFRNNCHQKTKNIIATCSNKAKTKDSNEY